jgi:hypothetical protein
MKKKQIAQITSVDRVIKLNEANTTNGKYTGILELEDEIVALKDVRDKLLAAEMAQSSENGMATNEVYEIRDMMCEIVIKYALRGKVKAKQLGMKTLRGQLDHSISYLSKPSREEGVVRAREIVEHIEQNTGALTNITKQEIIDMKEHIDKYASVKEVPVQNIQISASAGTDMISLLIVDAFDAIESIYDLLVSYFKGVDDTLVDEYARAKQIINAGVHHTGITGTVSMNDKPVAGAVVKIEGTKKEATTDIEGHYAIIKVVAGKYNVSATLPDGTTETKILAIVRGHIDVVNF